MEYRRNITMSEEKLVTEETVKVEEKAVKDAPVKDEPKADESKVEKKYTDADIDEIVNAKFAKWQEKKEKEINEAEKLAGMNAQERVQHEKDELEKELEQLRKANSMNQMGGEARAMLKAKNVSVEDDLLEILIADDADKTKENVDSFVSMFEKAVDAAVLAKIKGPGEKRGTTSTATKDEIMNIKDRELRQKKIAENIHLFN